MANSRTPPNSDQEYSTWQLLLQRFFARIDVELCIGLLIVVSVFLTFLELSWPTWKHQALISDINYGITCLFAVELTLRFLAAPSRAFFREFGFDIIAILPLFRPLRFARLIRLLRLFRILRLLGIFSRHATSFPYIFRRGAIEYVIVLGLIGMTVLFSTGAILALEHGNNDVDSFDEAMWQSLYTLLAGEPIPNVPVSVGGKLLSLGVMFMGMTVFAMFTGTVSAFMVERLNREGRNVRWEEFQDHIVICGWNRKAEIIVKEYHVARGNRSQMPIVVVAEMDHDPIVSDSILEAQVQFLNEDFTRVSALEKAGIHRARTCIILSDRGQGRSTQDADARTILAALTAEKLNPNVYTCAELNNREYGSHLDIGRVNDYVVSGEHSGFLLAQAALNRGLMGVFTELLTHERGNQFYSIEIPSSWIGRPFLEIFVELKRDHDAILVAVHDREQNVYQVNPENFEFQGGEQAIIISARPVTFQ